MRFRNVDLKIPLQALRLSNQFNPVPVLHWTGRFAGRPKPTQTRFWSAAPCEIKKPRHYYRRCSERFISWAMNLGLAEIINKPSARSLVASRSRMRNKQRLHICTTCH